MRIRIRTGSGPEFGFAPQIIWEQNQHCFSQRPFFSGSPLEFWQKKCPNFLLDFFFIFLVFTWILVEKSAPIFSKKLFLLFGIRLNFGRKNAPVFSEDFFVFGLHQKKRLNFECGTFLFFLVCFWFLLIWAKCNCILADPDRIRILKFKRWRVQISSCSIRIGFGSLNLWICPSLIYCS